MLFKKNYDIINTNYLWGYRMIKELIKKLKFRKQKLESLSNIVIDKFEESGKNNYEIKISKENNIYKVEMNDYIPLSDYCEIMDEIDKDNISASIFASVLFNSDRQSTNSGTYYIIYKDNKIYNILINESEIHVAERTIIGEEKEEKIIYYSVDGNDYHYFRCKHDKIGSSYDTKYYSKNGTCIPALELSREEFIDDINNLICNLKSIEGIENIYDIDSINEVISNNYTRNRNII